MIKSIGELNKRIEIFETLSEKDAEGFPLPEETKVVECWAAVKDGSYKANEHFTAALGRTTEITSFTVRDRIVRKNKVREGMYIRFEGDIYRIVARPYNANHARDFAVLNAECVGEVSG